jgi:hypothetical protein
MAAFDYARSAMKDDGPFMGLLGLCGQGEEAGEEENDWLTHGGHDTVHDTPKQDALRIGHRNNLAYDLRLKEGLNGCIAPPK